MRRIRPAKPRMQRKCDYITYLPADIRKIVDTYGTILAE